MKPKFLLIASRPRCGTHLLRSTFNSVKNIFIENECFHLGYARKGAKDYWDMKTIQEPTYLYEGGKFYGMSWDLYGEIFKNKNPYEVEIISKDICEYLIDIEIDLSEMLKKTLKKI